MREYLISFILLFSILYSYAESGVEYYRSNFNGLLLLKIDQSKIADYQYVVKNGIEDTHVKTKLLYEKNKEIKRWEYTYINDKLREEYYYKDQVLVEKYVYDTSGHKLNQIEYRDGEVSKNTLYEYNKDGLVSHEVINDLYLGRTNKVTYKYDSDFRIKQLIKEMYDGKIVYWDSFFTSKGVIIKEYYTLNNERYVFYYNNNGQELKGEVTTINEDKTEKLKMQWENTYAKDGKKIMKDEENFLLNKRIKTWYDKNARETRVETFEGNTLELVEEKNYDDQGNIIQQKEIKDLNIKEWRYSFNEQNVLYKTDAYENGVLKNREIINEDNTKDVTVYGQNGVSITIHYDQSGNKISEDANFK